MVLNYFNTFLQDVISLIAILDPIAAAAVMISLLPPGTPKRETDEISLRASKLVFFASLTTIIFGDLIFRLFGININSIKVIGGIILLLFAINMINGNLLVGPKHTEEELEEAAGKDDVSIVPLGIPVLFGPGVIATLVVLKERSNSVISILLLIIAVASVSFVTYIVLKNSRILMKQLGLTGFKIITRIMGLIVGAIASQFIVAGVKALWFMF